MVASVSLLCARSYAMGMVLWVAFALMLLASSTARRSQAALTCIKRDYGMPKRPLTARGMAGAQ